MSECAREHRPLLGDSASEDDLLRPYHCDPSRTWLPPRRSRMSAGIKGRARNKIKGAAAIMTQWPDHFSTSAVYCWLCLAVFLLLFVVIYNGLLACSLLPTISLKQIKEPSSESFDITRNVSPRSANLPEVFMHIIVKHVEDLQLHKYIRSLKYVTRKYSDYKYNLKILINDTIDNKESELKSESQNNANALKDILSNDNTVSRSHTDMKNLNIEQCLLSQYLDDSPLKATWRKLPSQFIPFFLRAVSVWDHGGVSFDPAILVADSASGVYKKRLDHIFKSYEGASQDAVDTNYNSKDMAIKKKSRINNIRDVIDALENDNKTFQSFQPNLTEAESRVSENHVRKSRKLLSNVAMIENIAKDPNVLKTSSFPKDSASVSKSTSNKIEGDEKNGKVTAVPSKSMSVTQNSTILRNLSIPRNFTNSFKSLHNDTKGMEFLPLFLQLLFNNKEINLTTQSENVYTPIKSTATITQSIEDLKHKEVRSTTPHRMNLNKTKKTYPQPMKTLRSEMVLPKLELPVWTQGKEGGGLTKNSEPVLTIDVKGKMIATKTPCHAFIGYLFTDAKSHRHSETITDFIIRELSLFCDGLLTSCKGINIIIV